MKETKKPTDGVPVKSAWQKVSVPSLGSEIIQHTDMRERGQAMSQEPYKGNWTTEPLFKDTTGKEVTRVLYKLWKNGLTDYLGSLVLALQL